MRTLSGESARIWRQLLKLGHGYRTWYVSLCLLAVITALANTAVAQVLRMIVNASVQHSRHRLEEALMVGMVVVVVAALSGFSASVVQSTLNSRSIRNLQLRMLIHLMAARLSAVLAFHTGDAINRIHDSASIAQSAVNQQAIQILQNVFQVTFTISYLSIVNVNLAIGAFAISLLTPIMAGPVSKRLVGVYVRRQQAQAGQQSFVLETIQGIEVVKGLGLGRSVSDKLGRLTSEWLALNGIAVKWESVSSRLNYLAIVSGFLFILGYGGRMVATGHLAPGAVAAFLIAFQQVFNPITQLSALWPQFRQSLAQADRVFELTELPRETGSERRTPITWSSPPRIAFSDVEFDYGNEQQVLHSVSCLFVPNAINVVVGPSGSGKSTLIGLMLGLYLPNRGRLLINQDDLREVDLRTWRQAIGYLPQNAPLLPGTVRENIQMGTEASDSDGQLINDAVWRAGADQFVLNLPQGLETIVADRGTNFSGGQRQRIGLARAIMRNAPVCLLDEPTAELDAAMEDMVLQRLEPWLKERTTIIITHRSAVAALADYLIVLQQGRVTSTDPTIESLHSEWKWSEPSAPDSLEGRNG